MRVGDWDVCAEGRWHCAWAVPEVCDNTWKVLGSGLGSDVSHEKAKGKSNVELIMDGGLSSCSVSAGSWGGRGRSMGCSKLQLRPPNHATTSIMFWSASSGGPSGMMVTRVGGYWMVPLMHWNLWLSLWGKPLLHRFVGCTMSEKAWYYLTYSDLAWCF